MAAPIGDRHLPNSKSFLALISADRAHKALQLRTRILANKICKNDIQIVNFLPEFFMNVIGQNVFDDFEIGLSTTFDF